jgi:hypothetical protein
MPLQWHWQNYFEARHAELTVHASPTRRPVTESINDNLLPSCSLSLRDLWPTCLDGVGFDMSSWFSVKQSSRRRDQMQRDLLARGSLGDGNRLPLSVPFAFPSSLLSCPCCGLLPSCSADWWPWPTPSRVWLTTICFSFFSCVMSRVALWVYCH